MLSAFWFYALFVCFCLTSSLLEALNHTLTRPKCFSLWILQISAVGVWMGQCIHFCDCDKMHEENSLQEGRDLRGPGCWGFSPWLTPWLWARGGKSGHCGGGDTWGCTKPLSARQDWQEEGEGRQDTSVGRSVNLSVCQSVNKIYPSMIASPLCVEGQGSVSEPWRWSHRQFWAARGGTQTLVPWKIASTLNQPQHALQHPGSLDTVRGHEQSWNGRLETKGGGYYITKDFKLTFSKYIEFLKYKIFEDKHLERQRNFQKKITAYDSTLEFSSC